MLCCEADEDTVRLNNALLDLAKQDSSEYCKKCIYKEKPCRESCYKCL